MIVISLQFLLVDVAVTVAGNIVLDVSGDLTETVFFEQRTCLLGPVCHAYIHVGDTKIVTVTATATDVRCRYGYFQVLTKFVCAPPRVAGNMRRQSKHPLVLGTWPPNVRRAFSFGRGKVANHLVLLLHPVSLSIPSSPSTSISIAPPLHHSPPPPTPSLPPLSKPDSHPIQSQWASGTHSQGARRNPQTHPPTRAHRKPSKIPQPASPSTTSPPRMSAPS